ncbi:hypothetical protein M5K25_000327 [Dendrobium thyrsiflorum]|uniref:Uncharacterized protein n=1 Tax=Dendrobium thyrsiflorum TaxID=117978 RepID=A0ABD0VVC0_DENTH
MNEWVPLLVKRESCREFAFLLVWSFDYQLKNFRFEFYLCDNLAILDSLDSYHQDARLDHKHAIFGNRLKYKPNDTKFNSIRAQMGPNQRPKARLEGSNHNLDYQTIPERDMLIFKSSSSTRRIQQAQYHQIIISGLWVEKRVERVLRFQELRHRRRRTPVDCRRTSTGSRPPPDFHITTT